MKTTPEHASTGFELAQLAWVVKDIRSATEYFRDVMGVGGLENISTSKAKDYDGTYYGKPSDGENLVAQTYAGGVFMEIIQPVSGNSIFQDFIAENPDGGLQHIAFRVPIAELDNVIARYEKNGYEIASRFDTPVADIVFFDTRREIGIFTEIMGITEDGYEAIEKMKG
jgi:methylmalonyl-CoA/ethylmalonyl-CoA epimerase